ncbi:hypothetical protein [Spirosoma montaniterrae]|uniref:Glycerophosphoryl diester phosphodiesterase membrane domain-containing protein n=1 Tax=Spirosoma montaniterrae TaxID=1178516 RepID=A0A1P9X348_9BACT|nr:hypothetical protein [Spirosoma montaniterrae]AQG82047.1 hypothetical protein AWR27_23780 [Spirosoma montaniterrae]
MIPIFQQREFGDKVNATFQYIAKQFQSLGAALLYIVGPVALLAGIASGIMQSNMLRLIGESGNANTRDFAAAFQLAGFFASPSFWLSMLLGIVANVAVILVVFTHMKRYANQLLNPAPISVGEVWADMQPAIGRVLLLTVIVSIVSGVATMFFIVPGIYLFVVLSLAPAIAVFEETDFGQTWNRCFALIRDKWWSTLGLIIVMAIIAVIISTIFSIPNAVIGFLVGATQKTDRLTSWLLIGNVISVVGQTLLYSLIYVAIGFQYGNLVERQEGRGLLSAIDQIGRPSTQPRALDEGEQ